MVELTVVLAVIGKQIPQFESLGILLSDEAALAPPITFYQRLLAGDVEEAADLFEEYLSSDGREAAYVAAQVAFPTGGLPPELDGFSL